MGGPFAGGLSLQDVLRAKARIAGEVRRTPLVPAQELNEAAGGPVFLKLENRQQTGSFKLRGALNAVLALSDRERVRGVVTVSTGNHGRAVAYACRQVGARATVCVSRLVPANKLAAIEELGAEVRVVGASQDEAQREADRLVAEESMTLVPPFDHPEVIVGQGTLGLEIAEQLAGMRANGLDQRGSEGSPDTLRKRVRSEGAGISPGDGSDGKARGAADATGGHRVLVPLSGGGLIAGVALALKSVDPDFRLVGVSVERGCAMYRSVQAGQPVEVEELASLADSLGGGIGLQNRYTFEMVRHLVDGHRLVDEEGIAAAIAHAYRFHGEVLEGAGAVGIAALLATAGRSGGSAPVSTGAVATVVVVSGGNIDPELHARLTAPSAGDEGEDASADRLALPRRGGE
jgi:threonine dehydratase